MENRYLIDPDDKQIPLIYQIETVDEEKYQIAATRLSRDDGFFELFFDGVLVAWFESSRVKAIYAKNIRVNQQTDGAYDG